MALERLKEGGWIRKEEKVVGGGR